MYPLIKTRISGYPIYVMMDTESASSHMVIEENQIPTFRKEVPLTIIGPGNKKSDLITNDAKMKLSGKYGEEVELRFNVLKNTIVSDLPGVSGKILERFSHITDHRSDLNSPILRGPLTCSIYITSMGKTTVLSQRSA